MSGSQDKKPIIEVGDLYLFAYHKKADKDTEIVCAKLSEVSESEKLVTFVDEDDKEYTNQDDRILRGNIQAPKHPRPSNPTVSPKKRMDGSRSKS